MRRPPPIVLVIPALPLIASGLIALGVVVFAPSSPWSDEPGRALAARLRAAGSPLIESVEFQPQRLIDPPEVHVIVRPGVTEDQAAALWCDVVVPAGGSKFEGDLGTQIHDSEGNWLAEEVNCP